MPLRLTILRFDSLASTNTEAARQAAGGAPEGLCVVAREQTAGRGRQQRVWVSPADAGLYFSIVLRPRLEMKEWPLLTLMAAIAVADALREACGLEVDIKWPNDIHAGGRKLCGILAETVENPPRGRACIIGIGINLTARAFPPELSEVATSIEKLTGSKPDVEALLGALLRAIERRYARWQAAGGGAESRREWSRRSSYAEGKRVRVALGEEFFEGTTRGLAGDGALRVETNDGKIRIVRAGDVTALRPVEGMNGN
ncbi:MAG: biotin--[acetyl-CoA-carboxylase] ligase [Pyrinomonadaceae bacterium]|nr:biotin--[acetyl-CoA-carboxylase] ligase [Pyrinomonadaceae bacterium]